MIQGFTPNPDWTVSQNELVRKLYSIAPNTGTAKLQWEVADADARCLMLVLPEGGTLDVPVFIIGDSSIDGKDFGVYEGVEHPTLVLASYGATARMTLRHDGANARFYSSAGDIELYPVGNVVRANADNDVDLGEAGTQWKNLYLSGSAYVDGNQGVSGTYPIYNDGTAGNVTEIVVNGGIITQVTLAP